MTLAYLLSAIANGLQRLACRIQEARRLRRDLQELSAMSAHELRDLGISHAAMAANASWAMRCD
jgi:uncharacterized protein YjiS (DUF1127 family)